MAVQQKPIPRLKERRHKAETLRSKIALPIYKGVDEEVSLAADEVELEGKPVRCEAGCSACCYQAVIITSGEAMVIAQHVHRNWADGDIEKLRSVLRHQAEQLFIHDRASWFHQKTPCPFLVKGLPHGTKEPEIASAWFGHCRIYQVRPVSCRIHIVVSDPAHCVPELKAGSVFSVNLSEIERKAAGVMQNQGYALLGRRWVAPLPAAVETCLRWLIDGKRPDSKEISKWMRRIIEWQQTNGFPQFGGQEPANPEEWVAPDAEA